ncbi:MAG TPA: tRNA preQ1(34) S-adenosylmethionine ribosyltransferase-isomerase QueA, partial [Vicinamibacterales bacterium]
FLRRGDLLVVNDTRVFPARLLGRRVPSGGNVECLLLAREDPDARIEVAHPGEQIWSALVHPGQKLKPGSRMVFEARAATGATDSTRATDHTDLRQATDDTDDTDLRRATDDTDLRRATDDTDLRRTTDDTDLRQATDDTVHKQATEDDTDDTEHPRALHAEILERQFFGRRRIRLWADEGSSIDAIVDAIGHVPLPPYIHRPDARADRERYQTVFADTRGSVAAPTAGLHFDRALLDALETAGVTRATVTLHVGYGTFKPVRVDDIDDHVVDPEPYSISAASAGAIDAARGEGRRVIAVGTTTTRALEDAAIRGRGRVIAGPGEATVFIRPGFAFKAIDGLLTNFHLPRSSLLMLVSAFAGRERVLAAYVQAVARRYRFYSYGDAMLVV